MTNILEIKDLSKSYGTHKALDSINMNVEEGAIFGLLGPNGAGKTTLLRIINSILISDTGSVKIDGEEAKLGESTKLIGYMPEERGLYPKMRVDDQIMYFGRLKGADKQTILRNMKEYMDIFNIAESDRHRKVEELSKGNQQKVQILATIVHQPKLIILDEPFSGFDPINGQLLTNLISRLQERNSTIILSSHNMPAIEEMASHIALINKGQLLLNGEMEELKYSNKTGEIEVGVAAPLMEEMLRDSAAVANVKRIDTAKGRREVTYRINPAEGSTNNDILSALTVQSSIIRFEEVLPSLTDLFLKYTNQTEETEK